MADLEELQPPEVSQRESVQDDVRAAFEQHSSNIAEKLISAKDTETPAEKADRLRDETGKFVAKDKTVERPEAAPEQFTDADRREEKPAAPSTAGGPPTSWSAGEKAEWLKLPPAVQQAVIRRETEIDSGGRQWSEQRKGYEQALAPVNELANQYQMPANEVVARLVSVEKRLGDPRQAPQVIAELAQAYGVDLRSLTTGSQQPAAHQAPNLDPQQLFQMLDQRVEQRMTEAEAKRRQDAETQGILGDFATQRDASGNPKYPHFEDAKVKVRMGRLLESGDATSMEDAYDQAVYSIPTIREQLIASMAAPKPGQVNKARSAAISLKGSPRGQMPAGRSESKGSVLDDVRSAWSDVMGNG